MKTFYQASSRNEIKSWTNDAVSLDFFSNKKNVVVQPSRSVGDFDLFIHGSKVGVLFESQEDQIQYLRNKKWI